MNGVRTLNDGSSRPPRLKPFLNLGSIQNLRNDSSWPDLEGIEALTYLKEQGIEGVQGADPNECEAAGLECAGGGRINDPDEAKTLAMQQSESGCTCATLHVGWGIEDDTAVDRLIGTMIEASDRYDFPMYVETHRATVTQDMRRTFDLVGRFPRLGLNGDFSHWYTGLEMPYGGLEMKLQFLEPVFEHVRFMHGRIGSSGSMQVTIGDGANRIPQAFGLNNFVDDFRSIWRAAAQGFLAHAGPGDYLPFAPELLDASAYYARMWPDPESGLVEESDRFAESLLYIEIMKSCFADAEEVDR